jgi:hypothetical protein
MGAEQEAVADEDVDLGEARGHGGEGAAPGELLESARDTHDGSSPARSSGATTPAFERRNHAGVRAA